MKRWIWLLVLIGCSDPIGLPKKQPECPPGLIAKYITLLDERGEPTGSVVVCVKPE